MSTQAKKTNYYPHTFKPNDFIDTLEKNGLKIDTSKEGTFVGQLQSMFNPVLVMRHRAGKPDDWVKPRLQVLDIKTRASVGRPPLEKGATPDERVKYRSGLNKINPRFDPDVTYEEHDGTIQYLGRAIVLFSKMYTELVANLRAGKNTESGKSEFGNGKSNTIYLPYKTQYTTTEGETVQHENPFIEFIIEFDEATGKSKHTIGDLRKSTSRNVVPVTMKNKDGHLVGINAENAHEFFLSDTVVVGEVDITTTSRTGAGSGVTAKLLNIRIIPGKKKERQIYDDETLDAIRNKYTTEEEEEEEGHVLDTLENANSDENENQLASLTQAISNLKVEQNSP